MDVVSDSGEEDISVQANEVTGFADFVGTLNISTDIRDRDEKECTQKYRYSG